MPTLEAVVNISHDVTGAPWPLPPGPLPDYVQLHGGLTQLEVGLVMAEVARYAGDDLGGLPEEVIERLLSDKGRVVGGGLLAREGEHEIGPACCCGLEGWREWLGLLTGDGSPWLGHSPDAWVEGMQTGFRVWSDGGFGDSSDPAHFTITFSEEELSAALDVVQQDLVGFVRVLERWAASVAPQRAALLVASMDRWFGFTEARES